ncbi:MAG: SURF1 family cytochrome oxidase biogenesis protein, partial [Pseudomonadota bacterium]
APAPFADVVYASSTGRARDTLTVPSYAKVDAVIRPLRTVPRLRYTARGSVAGWDVFAPGIVAGGDDTAVMFINLGFVRDQQRRAFMRAAEAAVAADGELWPDSVRVTGLVRTAGAQPSVFTPASEQVMNRYYWPDIAGMVAAVAPDLPAGSSVIDGHYIDALTAAKPPLYAPLSANLAPQPGSTRTKLSNRHLEYAVTWFGLAATLIGVFGAYAWSALRKRPLDQA